MADGFTFHVDLTSIMLFASALGETNPVYYDEECARQTPLGGVVAPPSFASASAHWNPRYSLRGVRQIPEAAAPESRSELPSATSQGEGRNRGAGDLARVLHGEQRFRYHKPMHPGMRLQVRARRGKSWSKEGRRGGTLHFSESITEYRDEVGELVVTATSVGITTSKAVEQ